MKTATTMARLQDFQVQSLTDAVVDVVHTCGDHIAVHRPSIQALVAHADAHKCPPRPTPLA